LVPSNIGKVQASDGLKHGAASGVIDMTADIQADIKAIQCSMVQKSVMRMAVFVDDLMDFAISAGGHWQNEP